MNSGTLFRTIVVIGALAALHACGGGDDGDNLVPPPDPGPPRGEGVFKDSNVIGLSYDGVGILGETGPNGEFGYLLDQPVTFKVGGVTLGSAMGNSVMTPIDLVPGGSSNTPAVLNIARFLLMLDADGDPSNGIEISSSVRTRAANWAQPGFDGVDIDTALEALAVEARSADAGTHVVPTASVARQHLETTFRCAMSGAFRGTFAGSDEGRFGVIITPNLGDLVGVVYGRFERNVHRQAAACESRRGVSLFRVLLRSRRVEHEPRHARHRAGYFRRQCGR